MRASTLRRASLRGRFSRLLTAVALLLLLQAAGPPSPAAAALPAGELHERLRAASLMVLADGRLAGSGAFVTTYGLALTAAHVVKGAGRLEILSPLHGRLPARLLATDPGHDLALLLVERSGPLTTPLDVADAAPAIATPLSLFGAALARQELLLPGTVARAEATFEWNAVNRCYTEVLIVSAMTPEGLSGAPWVDGDGRLAGVQSGMAVKNGALAGLAFIAPLSAVKHLITARQPLPTPSLGARFAEVWEWSPEGGRAGQGTAGVYLLDFLPGSPLAAAGVQTGELIVAIGATPLTSRDQLLAQLRRSSPGSVLTLTIVDRRGDQRTVSVSPGRCGD